MSLHYHANFGGITETRRVVRIFTQARLQDSLCYALAKVWGTLVGSTKCPCPTSCEGRSHPRPTYQTYLPERYRKFFPHNLPTGQVSSTLELPVWQRSPPPGIFLFSTHFETLVEINVNVGSTRSLGSTSDRALSDLYDLLHHICGVPNEKNCFGIVLENWEMFSRLLVEKLLILAALVLCCTVFPRDWSGGCRCLRYCIPVPEPARCIPFSGHDEERVMKSLASFYHCFCGRIERFSSFSPMLRFLLRCVECVEHYGCWSVYNVCTLVSNETHFGTCAGLCVSADDLFDKQVHICFVWSGITSVRSLKPFMLQTLFFSVLSLMCDFTRAHRLFDAVTGRLSVPCCRFCLRLTFADACMKVLCNLWILVQMFRFRAVPADLTTRRAPMPHQLLFASTDLI